MIYTKTLEEFLNDVSKVRALAEAAGLKGEPYQDIVGKGKKARIVVKYKKLNNVELYEFGKKHHREQVRIALQEGKEIPTTVLADYPDLR